MIVPKHDLVWREFRVVATADQCKDIASEKHLYNADATLEICTKMNCMKNSVIGELLPLLNWSLKGLVLNILKPVWVPAEKQP
jgi:hypothetical protein